VIPATRPEWRPVVVAASTLCDGAMGRERLALQSYSDDPGNTGLAMISSRISAHREGSGGARFSS